MPRTLREETFGRLTVTFKERLSADERQPNGFPYGTRYAIMAYRDGKLDPHSCVWCGDDMEYMELRWLEMIAAARGAA